MTDFKKRILKILDSFLKHYDQMWAYHENKHCTRNDYYSNYAEYMWLACNHIKRKIKITNIKIDDWNDIQQILDDALEHFRNLIKRDRVTGLIGLEKAHMHLYKALIVLENRLYTIVRKLI